MIRTEVRVRSRADVPPGAVDAGTREQTMRAMGAGFEVSQDRVPHDTSDLSMSGQPPQEMPNGAIAWG